MKRLVLPLIALVLLAIVLAEVLLQPAADDRWHLLLILVGPAAVAVALTPLLARWVSTMASVAGVALAVGLCSLALGALSSSAASNAMFVSSHDYRLFLVVLLMSSGIALVVGGQLMRPIARDVRRLGEVAAQVADGDLSVRTGIDRRDEVGVTAASIDRMVDSLRAADEERTQLTAARQHLFTSIGHDLRTPLAALRAAVESLEDGVSPDPIRYLAVMSAQLRTIDTMLDQMIEYSRLESGHGIARTERVSMTELIDECVEALSPLAQRRSIALVTHADGPAFVTGRPADLARVVRNLVDNALRHAPDGSSVTIAAVTHAASTSSGARVELTVADSGPGFPPDFRSHAFEPFRRADPSRNASTGNAGLGLAICQAIVQAHGGSITIVDAPGGVVRVELPTSDAASAPDEAHDTTGASA